MKSTRADAIPSPVRITAGLAGLAGIFLPFAGGFSPVSALADAFAPNLAAAAFLSPLITLMALRLLGRGSLTAAERGLGWLVSAGFLGVYCWGWYTSVVATADSSSISWGGIPSAIVLFLPLALLALGAWVTLRTARHDRQRGSAPILALRTMYVVNAAFALSAFFGGWQVGAWAILVAASVHLYLIGTAARRSS